MSILETYYTYAKLAGASYIDLSQIGDAWRSTGFVAGNLVVSAGSDPTKGRMPLALGTEVFGGITPEWKVLSPYYVTSPLTGHSDPSSGFAAMLLQNDQGQKVISIAGTEPTENVQAYFDLLDSDLAQIGFLGAAFEQLVSMFNYVQVLKAQTGSENVLRLEARSSLIPPLDGTPFETQLTVPGLRYWWLEAHYDGIGQGELIRPGETLTVTGHSLGGHVAALATALFPELFSTAYIFNAPGYDPIPSWLSQPGGTDDLLQLFQPFGASPISVATVVNRAVNLEAEDAVPGDDFEIIASK